MALKCTHTVGGTCTENVEHPSLYNPREQCQVGWGWTGGTAGDGSGPSSEVTSEPCLAVCDGVPDKSLSLVS